MTRLAASLGMHSEMVQSLNTLGASARLPAIGAALILIGATLEARAQQAAKSVQFPAGASSVTLKGTISGRGDRTYLISAMAGQTLQTLFSPTNRACSFNVFEPGSGPAVHIGTAAGNEFGRSATLEGAYRFQVYLTRSAARRNERCRYSLSIELTGKTGGSSAGVSDGQMRDRCKGEAAPMYGVQPRRVSVGSVRRVATGFEIDGTANKGAEGIKKLRCIFKPDRTFSHIMAMTSDGE
ncbi:MAG: hypothetical protein SFW09_12175 [Hyphomicrobiaceae bacterium]|nr:hypothetical protein [Hyphomicrobiaceae bacterium]